MGCGDSARTDPPSAPAEWAHCGRCAALALGGSACQGLPFACQALGSLDSRWVGGRLTQLSSHSLQLYVPREVPEAREDALFERGAQPGPSAYECGLADLRGAGVAAWGGRGWRVLGREAGWLVGWGGTVPLRWFGPRGCRPHPCCESLRGTSRASLPAGCDPPPCPPPEVPSTRPCSSCLLVGLCLHALHPSCPKYIMGAGEQAWRKQPGPRLPAQYS